MNHAAVDAVRLKANSELDPDRKTELGQFMTPSVTAMFMAGLFSQTNKPVRLLDPGAGIGSLSAAYFDRFKNTEIFAEAWEVDPVMRRFLSENFEKYESRYPNIKTRIFDGDFIHGAVQSLASNQGSRFTHAILNPPYAKINSKSEHRLLLRQVGIETVNLYTAFVALTILLMEQGGEIVAIIPRSFCNGTYYKPFRQLLLDRCAIRQIHLFESRRKAFKDDDVLQENIIIHLAKNAQQGPVTVTTSHGLQFDELELKQYPFEEILKPGDEECFIHIPTQAAPRTTSPLFSSTLNEIGVEVCTGPVVDFRLKEDTRKLMEPGTVPLLYAHHFQKGVLAWPNMQHKKPNAICISAASERWLMPAGWYVIVKRFSSKEEKRRIVAYVVDPSELPGELIGFENHWNVFHSRKAGLDKTLALGLAAFLNSTVVDNHFRVFSGHTQVNATDLRTMKYPTRDELLELGRLAGKPSQQQQALDAIMEQLEGRYGN